MRYSIHNPIFKKELLFSLIGCKIVAAKFYFINNPKIEDNGYILVPNRECIIEIEFSSGMKLDFTYLNPKYLEVRETLVNEMKCHFFPNKNKRMNVGYIKRNVVRDLDAFIGLGGLKEIIESQEKIQNVFLIKLNTRTMHGYNKPNPFYIQGLSFEFNSRKLYIHHDNVCAIKLETNCNEIEKGVLFLSSDFILKGRWNKNYSFGVGGLMIPEINFEEGWVIPRENVIKGGLIDVSDIKNMKPSSSVIYNILKYVNDENREVEYIKFLNDLKEDILKRQYGIAELKIGIDNNSKMGIAEPIDIIEPLAENIIFIDNIIKAIDDNEITLISDKIR